MSNLAALVGFSFEYSNTCPVSSFKTMHLICVQASFYAQFVFQRNALLPACYSIVAECLWPGAYSFVICFFFLKDWHSEALPETDLQGF